MIEKKYNHRFTKIDCYACIMDLVTGFGSGFGFCSLGFG